MVGTPDNEALHLIKEIHKAGGTPLNNAELIEFITKPIYMGMPQPLPAKGRGRKPKRTQYDGAYDRRKGFYHRLVRLPASGASARLGMGNWLRDIVLKLAREMLPHTKQHKLVFEVLKALDEKKLPLPDESTIRKVLANSGIRTPKAN